MTGPLWPAILLLLAAPAAWLLAAGARHEARGYLRMAAALQAALAVAAAFDLSAMILAPLTAGLSAVLLAFAVQTSFRRPVGTVFSSLALTASCLAGIGASFSGELLPALLPQLAAVAVMLFIARRGLRRLSAPGIQLTAGALALLAAACSMLAKGEAALPALLMFSTAGLLGIALAVARISDTFVQRRRPHARRGAIGGLG